MASGRLTVAAVVYSRSVIAGAAVCRQRYFVLTLRLKEGDCLVVVNLNTSSTLLLLESERVGGFF